MSHYLEIESFRATALVERPFKHLIVKDFISVGALDKINADYPKISSAGSFPVDQVAFGPAVAQLLDELNGDEFREAAEEKFGLELAGRPTITTVRGWCGPADGKIHTDSTNKIITVLIYINRNWGGAGGRLRLLNSSEDIEDVISEVEPAAGTLLAFQRSSNSWHGHKPFVGERRVIQFNWLTSKRSQQISMLRHQASARFKRVLQMISPNRT